MFLVIQLFVLSACVYFTASNGVVQNFQDFSMLSCSEFRNVTFISINEEKSVYYYTFGYRFFVQELNDLLDNEACFMVNYFNGFDIVRWRNNNNINQFKFRTNKFRDSSSRIKNEKRKIAELMKQIYDDKIMGNDVNIKQTLVLTIEHIKYADFDDILKSLELLQNERQWTIILFRIDTYFKRIDWLPLNRNIQTQVGLMVGVSLQHPVIKTLFDVIKNPDYDVYDMTYRWIMSKKNLFTDDCMKEVRKIFVTIYRVRFTYIPIASAILKKVNAHRSKVNQEPLEIHFSDTFRGIMSSSDGHLTFSKFKWDNHPLHRSQYRPPPFGLGWGGLYRSRKKKNKSHVYIHIFSGEYFCRDFMERQDFYYRYFLSNEVLQWFFCSRHVNAKTFVTGEELFEHINDDLCKN
eukprot:TCONS_00008677-protein